MDNNEMKLTIKSLSENEIFARSVVASFCVGLNPTIEEIGDIKTAVSEAVTNCVVHAYPDRVGYIDIFVSIFENTVTIKIQDYGVGIADIKKAMQPFFTSKPYNERSGMGFTVMEGFMDKVEVTSRVNGGTCVVMTKEICAKDVKVGG